MDLSAYLAESIRDIMAKAYLNVLSNPREARFMARMQRIMGKAERRRKECHDKEGLEVPPFLIAGDTPTKTARRVGQSTTKTPIPWSMQSRLALERENIPLSI